MSDLRPDPALILSLAKVAQRYLRTLAEAEAAGKVGVDGRLGVMIGSLMRGVDRIAALPTERDLTHDEQDLLKTGAIQIAVAAIVLVDELPSEGLAVMVAGFDVGNPQ